MPAEHSGLTAHPMLNRAIYLIKAASGLFNTRMKCRLRDTYPYLLYAFDLHI